MTHRERVLKALGLSEPDRVPLFYRDVPEVEERLLRDLALQNTEELLQHFDIDFRWVAPEYTGPSLTDHDTGLRRDIWGVEYRYSRFSDGAGYWEVARHPLADATDPEALADYRWPTLDWFDFSTLAEQAKAFEEYAIMTSPGFASPGIVTSTIVPLAGHNGAGRRVLRRPDTQLPGRYSHREYRGHV